MVSEELSGRSVNVIMIIMIIVVISIKTPDGNFDATCIWELLSYKTKNRSYRPAISLEFICEDGERMTPRNQG